MTDPQIAPQADPQADQVSPLPEKQSFAALRHRGFFWYFLLSAMAMMADSVEHVVSYDAMWDKFKSQELQGFAVISHWVPFLLFSIHAGALADRVDPRKVIILGMVLFMIATLGWGYFLLTDTLEVWHAVVLLIIHGLAGVFWAPAGQMLIHDIVGNDRLQSGVRLMATSRTLGVMLGPAMGGALLLFFDHAWALILNAFIYVPLIIWCLKAPYGPAFYPPEKKRRPAAMRGMTDIAAALKAAARHRIIMSMTLLAGGASFFVGNAHQALMPEFTDLLVPTGVTGLSENTMHYVALFGAGAAGALIAGVVLESRSLLTARPRTAFTLVLFWCVAMGSFAISGNYYLSFALLLVAGFLDLSFNSMTQTLVQLNTPPDARGKVLGLYAVSSLGMKSFSGVTVGIAGGLIGIQLSLGISAAALFLFTIGLMAYAMALPAQEPAE
jgi:MFS family permease